MRFLNIYTMVFEKRVYRLMHAFCKLCLLTIGLYLKSISTKYHNNMLFKCITMNYTFYSPCRTRIKSTIFYFIFIQVLCSIFKTLRLCIKHFLSSNNFTYFTISIIKINQRPFLWPWSKISNKQITQQMIITLNSD